MLSIMLSAICYGVAFTPFWACLDLIKGRPRRHDAWYPSDKAHAYHADALLNNNDYVEHSEPDIWYHYSHQCHLHNGAILGNTGTICIVFSNWLFCTESALESR
jgi:hypothetical protein